MRSDLVKSLVHVVEVDASNRLFAIEQFLLSNGGLQLCVRNAVLQRQVRFHKRREVISCFDQFSVDRVVAVTVVTTRLSHQRLCGIPARQSSPLRQTRLQ